MPALLHTLSPRRIAVFRALQLGDLLCAVPALRALRAAMPQAHITLIGLPWVDLFAPRYPRYIDATLTVPGLPGFPEQAPATARLPEFLREAHTRAFDLAIQLHGNGRLSNVLTAWLGACTSVGFCAGDDASPLDHALPYPDGMHESERLLRLLAWLGAPAAGNELEFAVTDADRASLERIEAARTLMRGRYVCVHPGARDPRRRWTPGAFALIADALAARGARIVLTGSPEEAPLTQAVAAAMRAPALDLAGRTDLGALAALLAGARLLVCNDTGVSHLAAALRLPSVVLFSGSDPARWAPRDRARHRPVRASEADALARATASAVHLLIEGRADAA